MQCNACGAAIELRSSERIGTRDTCATCSADLHSCVNCGFHDPSAYNECREPNAERVNERSRGNRCDYFSPGEQGGGEAEARRSAAVADLDALFKK